MLNWNLYNISVVASVVSGDVLIATHVRIVNII